MKLLITSSDALIDNQTGDFFPDILNCLDEFLLLSKDNKVVVISIHDYALQNVPKRFHPLLIKAKYRGSPVLVNYLKKELNYDAEDIIILGSKNFDMYIASNTKSLLLRAIYARKNNPEEIFYIKQYGIPIKDCDSLTHFFNHFTNIKKPWFYKLKIDDITTMYALTNANTMGGVSATQKQLNDKFRDCLKAGVHTYRRQFMVYFLVSTYAILKELKRVNYWGIYPSSKTTDNADLEYFKKKARQAYNCKEDHPLFLRTQASIKRSEKGKKFRIDDGCDSQLNSIIINPFYKNKLKGKCVCVIDDFTTYGTSCETVRLLLEKAGVTEIIFIALGKFGNEYYKFDYELKGDVFTGFIIKKNNAEEIDGEFNKKANFEFIQSLGDML